MSTVKINLNLVPGAAPGGILPKVRVSQNDAVDRILQFELYDGTEEADLSEVDQAYIGGTKPDGNGFTVACTLSNNVATAALTAQSTVLPGNILCKLYLIYSWGSVRSATFTLAVDPDPLAGANESESDIQEAVAAAQHYAQQAEESADNAASAAAGAVAGKLDKDGGDSKDVITTFTSLDNAADTGLITTASEELSVNTITSGEKQSSLFNKITGLALNLRRTVNAVKAIWGGISDDWDSNGHAYQKYDVVWYLGKLRICKLDHTSLLSIPPTDPIYWEDTTVGNQISSCNSNYTNLSSLTPCKQKFTIANNNATYKVTNTANGMYIFASCNTASIGNIYAVLKANSALFVQKIAETSAVNVAFTFTLTDNNTSIQVKNSGNYGTDVTLLRCD